MLGHDSHRIYEYDSNWNYIGDNFYFGGEDITPMSIYKVNSGWWMLGHEHDRVYKYGDSNNEFENAPPDLNLFLIYIIVGLSIGIFGLSLIFIYVLKVKKKKAQTLVREIIDNKKIQRNKKENLCPFCGTANLKGWKFCTTCGKRMKPKKVSIDASEFLGGFIISLIGGLSSIALGLGIPFVYPELVYYMEDVMLILQAIMIIGGVVNIIGAILIFANPKLGGVIVLVGSFIAGINIIAIIGATRIFKKLRNKIEKTQKSTEIVNEVRFIYLEKRRKAEQIIYNFLMENKGKAFTLNSINSRCLELRELDLEIDDIVRVSRSLYSLGKIGMEIKENEAFYYIR